MPQFSNSTDVAGLAAYPATAQIIIPFTPRTIALVNEHATEPVFFSFDGVNTHGRLTPGICPAMEWDVRTVGVWFKPVSAATAAPVTVRLMADTGGA